MDTTKDFGFEMVSNKFQEEHVEKKENEKAA